MADHFKEKRQRTGIKAMSQHEADAQAIREKTTRLRALRLAREGPAMQLAATQASSGPATIKKKARKPREKAPSLSDWLATQQKEGRRG
jgi:hypothetical protein